MKSPSLQRTRAVHSVRHSESSENQQPPADGRLGNGALMEKIPSIRRQDSFEMKLPDLPKIEVPTLTSQISNSSNPESPVSPLLSSNPNKERSHSKTFSQIDDMAIEQQEKKDFNHNGPPSFWRLFELSLQEWFYALLGSTGAAIFGSFNPLLAYTISLVVIAYYGSRGPEEKHEVNKWCLMIACMGGVTVLANVLQHFYFGIMGEKMTERIRRMMFSGKYLFQIDLYFFVLFLIVEGYILCFFSYT